MAGKGKIKKLLKKGVNKVKEKVKGELKPKNLAGRAVDAVKDAAKDKSRSTRRGKKTIRLGQPRQAEPDIVVSKNIQLKDRKKSRQKKKIAKWEKEKKANAAAGSQQAAFLALDRKFKSKK